MFNLKNCDVAFSTFERRGSHNPKSKNWKKKKEKLIWNKSLKSKEDVLKISLKVSRYLDDFVFRQKLVDVTFDVKG